MGNEFPNVRNKIKSLSFWRILRVAIFNLQNRGKMNGFVQKMNFKGN